jgi:ligand-binding sensor domain-containing protein
MSIISICLFAKSSFNCIVFLSIFSACHGQGEKNFIPIQNRPLNGLSKILKPQNSYKEACIGSGYLDKKGKLWFPSNGEGIYCYDGTTFTHFTTKDGLDNNIVYSILEDKLGNVWAGTKTGLCKYDGQKFAPVPMTLPFVVNLNSDNVYEKSPSTQNGVWVMTQDKSGKIWLGTDDGLLCYDGKYFSRFLDTENLINKGKLQLKAIFSIVQDHKGNMWFGSCIGEGLIKFDGTSLKMISPKGYAWTDFIIEDKNGYIWFGSGGKGVCRYDGNYIDANFFKESDTKGLLYMLWKDKADNIWFGDPYSKRNLHYYDGKEKVDFVEKNYHLIDKKMFPIVQDKDGNIWFASEGMNLYKYDGKTFTNFLE